MKTGRRRIVKAMAGGAGLLLLAVAVTASAATTPALRQSWYWVSARAKPVSFASAKTAHARSATAKSRTPKPAAVQARPAHAPELAVLPLPKVTAQAPDVQDGYNAKPVNELLLRAKGGDSRAQYTLGMDYRSGRGVTADPTEAFKWQSQAAKAGFAPAQADLGFMYMNGVGTTQDATQAMNWVRQAADRGDRTGQYLLGILYENGGDAAQAFGWFQKSAAQGFSPAQWKLGTAYFNGIGTEKDTTAAWLWLRTAAGSGDPAAEYALGQMFMGNGTDADTKQAVDWFQRAAAHGYPDAAYNLGGLYYEGKGVAQNYAAAYEWMAIAQWMGADDAGKMVPVLEHHLTATQITHAKAVATAQIKAWKLVR